MKIGLALGGGGARGFFHLGVLKALDKLGIKVDIISGTSIGALIGGCFSVNPNLIEVEDLLLKTLDKYKNDLAILKKDFSAIAFGDDTRNGKPFDIIREIYLWNLCVLRPYLIEPRPFLRIFKEIFLAQTFSDCKIPFIATSVDLISGKLFFLTEGFLYKAVIASTAIPGFFPPYNLGDKILVDGGVLETVPTRILFEKDVDFIIGVNLESLQYTFFQFKNAIDILCLVDKIRYKKILKANLEEADFLIFPQLEQVGWGDFDRANELIKLGEKFTLERSEELLRKIRQKKIKKFFKLKSFKKANQNYE